MGPARTLFWFHPSRFGLGGMISTSLRTFQPRVFMISFITFVMLFWYLLVLSYNPAPLVSSSSHF